MQKRTFLTDGNPVSIDAPVQIIGLIVINATDKDCVVAADNGDTFPCPAKVISTWSLPPTLRVSAVLSAPPTNGEACNVIVTDEATLNSTSQLATLASSQSQAGAMQLIQTLGPIAAAQATLDFAAIPNTFRSLLILGQLRTTQPSGTTAILMRFNADAGLNYDSEGKGFRSIGDFIDGPHVAQNSFFVGLANGQPNAVGSFSPIRIEFPDYSGAILRKQFNAQSWSKNNGDADGTNYISMVNGGEWRSVNPVNEITLFPNVNSWEAGCQLSLYGIEG